MGNLTSPESESTVSKNSSTLGLLRGMMMKWEPVFVHLLKLFIDADRVEKIKDKKRFSVDGNEQDYND